MPDRPVGTPSLAATAGARAIMADEPVSGPPWQGRYAFDPRSIRLRDTDQSPA